MIDLESDRNLFITGKAGTGKSTLLKKFVANTSKNTVVLAPTGVAAINVSGQTIHSFFQLPPRIITNDDLNKDRNPEIYKNIDTIIIDEISMVRADLFDAMDKVMRKHKADVPFGGAQLILFGDMYQLPPIVTSEVKPILYEMGYESPYFFDSHTYDKLNIKIIELKKVYRQTDNKFIELLNDIRTGDIDQDTIDDLNQRVRKTGEGVILSTTNKIVNHYNESNLSKLSGEEKIYVAQTTFRENEAPADIYLKLKIGARVIFLRNDKTGRFVNGSLGTVAQLGNKTISVKMDETGEVEIVGREIWKKQKYKLVDERIETEQVGEFIQFPLRLAWALTIHKSQGQTIEKLFLDISESPWEHGQIYVALSRCTSFENLSINREITPRDIIVDPRINEFFEHYDRLS